VRLIGDIELTGSPEDLANLGQVLVDRFRTSQFVLVTGDLSSGLTFHGPTAPGEDGADHEISGLHDVTWDFYELVPVSAEPARPHNSDQGSLADRIARFRTAAAVMAAQDEKATALLDETIDTGETNHEADVRQDADDAAREAVRLAYRILTGSHLDEASEAMEALELRSRVAKALSATLNLWQPPFAAAMYGVATALVNGHLTEDALAEYPVDHHSEPLSRAIARTAGLAYDTDEPAYDDDDGFRIDVTAEHVGTAIDALRAVLAGDAAIEDGTTLTDAAHLVPAGFARSR